MAHNGSLSRRERQIMDILYRKKNASVAEIRSEIPDSPSYSAIRVIVNVLERKGHLRHDKRGKKYVYSPKTPRTTAVQGALQHLLSTYFDNSLPQALTAMLKLYSQDLSREDIERLSGVIKNAKMED